MATSNNRDNPTRSLYYCLFVLHIYVGVILHVHHICGESHIQLNTNWEVGHCITHSLNFQYM